MARLEGKVALVTGGASGLGKADCTRFVAEGATVFVSDINAEAAQELAASLGENAIAVTHDVGSEADWKRVYADIAERYGRLDILVNNAGIVLVADPEETTLDQYERVMRVMATSVFLGCNLACRCSPSRGLPQSSTCRRSLATSVIRLSLLIPPQKGRCVR